MLGWKGTVPALLQGIGISAYGYQCISTASCNLSAPNAPNNNMKGGGWNGTGQGVLKQIWWSAGDHEVSGVRVSAEAGEHAWEAPLGSRAWAQHERVLLAGKRGGTLYSAVRKTASRFLSDGVALNDLRAQMVCAAGQVLWAPCLCRGELRAPALHPGGSPHPVAPCRLACLPACWGWRGGKCWQNY